MKGFMYEAYSLLEGRDNKSLKEAILALAKELGYTNAWLYGDPSKIVLHHNNMKNKGAFNNLLNLSITTVEIHNELHKLAREQLKEFSGDIHVIVNELTTEYIYEGLMISVNQLLETLEKLSEDVSDDE